MEHGVKVPRIHDLEMLVNEVMNVSPGIDTVLKSARMLYEIFARQVLL